MNVLVLSSVLEERQSEHKEYRTNIEINALIKMIYYSIVSKEYHIRPNYCIYPYKHTVKQFSSLQITASVLFVYFFIKAYVVGTNLNCINLLMQFKWVPILCTFMKKIRQKKTQNIT